MGALWSDLAFSVRALLRAPLLLATAVLTLAIGIGLSTGVFAVAYGVLLRGLPYGDPGRIVVISIHRANQQDREAGLRLPEVAEWRRRARAFAVVAAHSAANFTLRGAGEPRSVRGAMVTDGFFDALGVAAAEGSTAGIHGTNPAAALSAGLADRIGRDGSWRERGVSIGVGQFAAAAVMPRTFAYPSERIEVWVAADAVPRISFFTGDDQRDFRLVARLAPGVTLVQAQDDAARVAAELNEGLTDARKRYATVQPLDDAVRRGARGTLAPFAAGALLVLLIACANVSGLLMSRGITRRQEFAVRRALGGGALDLLRASLAESCAIACLGWALGLWFGHLVVRGFVAFGSEAVANLQYAQLDAPVVVTSLGLAIAVALLSGATPAIRAIRTDAGAELKQTSERAGRGGRAARGALAVAQIAMTVVLIVCAGLLARTVLNILAAQRGFDPKHALVTRLTLSDTVRFNATEHNPFVERLVSDARALPGAVAAGVGSDLPPNAAGLMMTIRIVRDEGSETFGLNFSAVTPGYLEAIGATVVKGRLFEDRDRLATTPSVVVTESAARRMFQDRDPIGREWPATVPTPAGNVKPRVIGVVRDVRYGGLDREPMAGLFAEWHRIAPSQGHLVVRTAGNPIALSGTVLRTLRELNPSLPVMTPQTLEDVVVESLAERRLRLRLAIVFAALALLLSAVALWGTIAQGVLERRREIAIRLALGSTPQGAVRLMVRGGALLVVVGVLSGVPAAGVSARGLRYALHGVAPLDPWTFALGAAVAAVVSMLACYWPARRAASISPAELLREG